MPYEPRWRRLQVRRRGDSGESRNRASEVLAAMVVQPRVMRAARNATPGTATAVATSPRRIVDPPVGGLASGGKPAVGDLSRPPGGALPSVNMTDVVFGSMWERIRGG